MNATPSHSTAAAPASAADREVQVTGVLVGLALLAGYAAQVFVPPGPITLVAATGLAGAVVLGLAYALPPGRLRAVLSGFRFTSTLLAVLAVLAILGTLVIQGESPDFYARKYGAVAGLIHALRLDDIFHGLPFGLVMALFVAAVTASATLRWPIKGRNAGFFICHVGLLTSLAGAAGSTLLAKRGMIWLPERGVPGNAIIVEKGTAKGQPAELGFDIRLDRFVLDRYHSEYRVGFYELEDRVDEAGRSYQAPVLKASFDACGDGVKCETLDTKRHVLPGGDSFRVKAYYPDFVPVATATPAPAGPAALHVTLAGEDRWLADGESAATPDGTLAVAFGWAARPAAAPGALTSVLVSGAEGKIVLQRADSNPVEQPLTAGAALLGGVVRIGEVFEHAQRTFAPGTRSSAWNNPAALLEWKANGALHEKLVFAAKPEGLMVGERSGLVFEKREEEAKAFTSHLSVAKDGVVQSGLTASVNAPLEIHGWTFYQNSYRDPRNGGGVWVTGLEAVHDPGVPWVFTGFFLICVGVAYMFYAEPRLKGRKAPADASSAPAKAA